MRPARLTALFCLSVSLIACQKEVTSALPSTTAQQPTAPQQAPRLSAVYYTDSSTRVDTTLIMTISYDAAGRVAQVRDITLQGPGDTSGVATATYGYTGTDTLASSCRTYTRFVSGSPGRYYDLNEYYTYQNGYRVKDSIIRATNVFNMTLRTDTVIINYVRNGNQVFWNYSETSADYSQTGQMTFSGPLRQWTSVDGMQRTTYPLSQPMDSLVFHETATYEAVRPNPLNKIYRAAPTYRSVGVNLPHVYGASEINELLLKTSSNSSSSTVHGTYADVGTYTYTYRPDGYPSEGRAVITGAGQMFTGSVYYKY